MQITNSSWSAGAGHSPQTPDRERRADVLRRIQSFVQDDRERWVARLECGHLVDVPPDAHPPAPEWSRTELGRKNLVGSLLRCPSCTAGRAEQRPNPVVHAVAPRPSWRSFWARPKAPPARIEPVWLDPRLACGSVRSIQDLERLARLGFRHVLSLDQAGEPGQALSPHIAASWIRALAMTPHWVSVDPARIDSADVDRFLEVVASLRGPTFVHSNGAERADAFATIWLGSARGLDASEALRTVAGVGLRVGPRCADLVGEQLSRLRAGDGQPHVAPRRCFSFIDPPHVPHGEDLAEARPVAGDPEPPSRSNFVPDTLEIIRWETDGGTAVEDLLEELPQTLVSATCSPHASLDV